MTYYVVERVNANREEYSRSQGSGIDFWLFLDRRKLRRFDPFQIETGADHLIVAFVKA